MIHPLANGTVEFWLEAVNGGLEEYQGSEYQSEHIKLIIQEGANPYLRIPEQEITLRAGDPLTLRWASNLAQKNSEYGADAESRKTTFTIKVYQGEDIESQPVKTYTVTYDPATPDDTITMGDGTTLPMWTKDESDALTPNQSFVIPELTDTGVGYTITITAQGERTQRGSGEKPGRSLYRPDPRDRDCPARVRVPHPARHPFQGQRGQLDHPLHPHGL